MIKKSVLLVMLCTRLDAYCQPGGLSVDTSVLSGVHPGPGLNKKKILIAGGGTTVFYAGSLIALNQAWYKGYARTSFHTFNDSREWLQVDKIGHAWSVYNLTKYSTALWDWTGIPHKKAVITGGLTGAGYLTIIEFLDAHSAKWGWSWADMGANITGSGLFISQELLWEEQRIQFKFSAHRISYDASLRERTNDLFGNILAERILKDYNGQTYWLSANIRSFFPKSNLPAWLNFSFGYGADGLLGGFENKWNDQNDPRVFINRRDIPRKRQFYLSPDIDFTKIHTNKKVVRTFFNFLNTLKMPAPALMIDSKGKFKGYLVYF